jgi:hypothetical protein
MTDFPENRVWSAVGQAGAGARRLDDILGSSPPKRPDDPPPGGGASRLDDILNPPPPPLSPQRQAFEAAVARVIQIRGLPRREAERAAFDIVLVELLNATHPDTDPNRCACCGRLEAPDAGLLPHGTGPHAWLHSECSETWRADRRARVIAALTAEGVP